MASKVWFVFALLCVVIHAELSVKHLAGPPSEFPDYFPLDPVDFPDVQRSASFRVHLAAHHDQHVLSKTLALMVDSRHEFRFALFSPHSSLLHLSLFDPSGSPVVLQADPSFIPVGEEQIPGSVYTISEPMQGEYKLQVSTVALNSSTYSFLTSNSQEDAYILLWNEDALAMHTTLNTFVHVTGNQVGLVTRVFDSSISSSGVPAALLGHKQKATMNVRYPDGDSRSFPMQDDGLSADGEAFDGVYGALVTVAVAGQYTFEATISGTNEEGVGYVRTTTQLVRVVPQSLTISGTASALLDSERTRVVTRIAVSAPVDQQYYAYAEVWGVNEDGKEIPVSWIGGMTSVQGNHISLELDLNWISMAGAREPLTLRNVMIKDPNYFVPIAQYDEIPVKTPVDLKVAMISQSLKGPRDLISEEMRVGRKPQRNISEVGAPTVYTVLVHGYCSGSNPFAANPSGTWTNGKFFLKANANMLNDVFAKNVIAWAEQSGLGAYSFVGHSQGGMVGTHMVNYFWTGLDYVSGGRIVQTLGTPFQGCSAAGTAANLGYLFGVSCGANDNLTPTGAVNWLQGITSTARSKVNYYTTTYAQGQPFGDYCNMAMNLLLDFPNDGTTEYERAQLTHAVNQGNTQRWCHVTNMKYPPQYTEEARNKLMNANAARTYKA